LHVPRLNIFAVQGSHTTTCLGTWICSFRA
jgi:hypothetical protein